MPSFIQAIISKISSFISTCGVIVRRFWFEVRKLCLQGHREFMQWSETYNTYRETRWAVLRGIFWFVVSMYSVAYFVISAFLYWLAWKGILSWNWLFMANVIIVGIIAVFFVGLTVLLFICAVSDKSRDFFDRRIHYKERIEKERRLDRVEQKLDLLTTRFNNHLEGHK